MCTCAAVCRSVWLQHHWPHFSSCSPVAAAVLPPSGPARRKAAWPCSAAFAHCYSTRHNTAQNQKCKVEGGGKRVLATSAANECAAMSQHITHTEPVQGTCYTTSLASSIPLLPGHLGKRKTDSLTTLQRDKCIPRKDGKKFSCVFH